MKFRPFNQGVKNSIVPAIGAFLILFAVVLTFLPQKNIQATGPDVSIVDSGGTTPITHTSSSTVKVLSTAPTWGTLGTNLIANAGCETNANNWTGANASIARATSTTHSGSGSCRATYSGSGNYYGIADSPNTVANPTMGDVYTASVWVKTDTSNTKNIVLALRANGGAVADYKVTTPKIHLSQTWQQLNMSIVVDRSDRTSISFAVNQSSAAGSETFLIDDVVLAKETPSGSITTSTITFAEDSEFSTNVQSQSYTTSAISYTFANSNVGTKSVYVKFLSSTSQTRYAITYPATVEMVPTAGAYDMGVTYIDMATYKDRYILPAPYPNGYPRLQSGTESDPKWPTVNSTVTMTGYYKNYGPAATGNIAVRWSVDGVSVRTAVLPPLASGSTAADEYAWSWQNGDHRIKFEVDYANTISDTLTVNNSREDYTNAAALNIQVENTAYSRFNASTNLVGTKSFEDWVQAHADAFNAKNIASGGTQRMRIGQILKYSDGALPNNGTHSFDDTYYDGSWGFVSGNGTDYWSSAEVANWIYRIQPALVHEWTHQLGMAHSYDANVDIASDNHITGERLIQRNPDIVGVGGDDIMTAYDQSTNFTPYFVKALETNKGYRRGYYADYLFDVPTNNKLIIKDATGSALPNATVNIWQSSGHTVQSGSPKMTGTTNSSGEFTLTNYSIPEGDLTTATGHTLHSNPFGQILVTGDNGLFLIEINDPSNYEKDYKILTVHDFNLAYWNGNTTNATYTINTALVTSPISGNKAAGQTASASSTTSPSTPAMGVDGDKTSTSTGYWQPNSSSSGEYWQVDLGSAQKVYRLKVYAFAGNGHDLYQQFHIATSTTGAFSGEQTSVVTETNWDNKRGPNGYVIYGFAPISARYIRLTSDVAQGSVKMQEVEAYTSN